MQLSVVILNYNVRYFLELCLQSVEAALNGLDAEIIVVDNHSSDDSCQMVKELFPNVLLIENSENYGFSKGNNIGVAQAKGDYVCILNPDTVVSEDTFHKILEFAQSKQKLGIVGCRLIDGKGKFLPESKRNVPTPEVSIQKILGNSKPYYATHLNENETGKVDILVGAFMLLKQSVYNEVNGFDEDFFMYGEDLDFSYRIMKAGYKNYYNPTTTIIHFKGESTLKDKTYAKRFYQTLNLFFKKHFKLNPIYKMFIWIGIQGVILLNPKSKEIKYLVEKYVLVSDKSLETLKSKLTKPVQIYSEKEKMENHTQVIFDARTNSFKSMIDFMSNSSKNKDWTFRILPKYANYILGSDTSTGRGEVIHF